MGRRKKLGEFLVERRLIDESQLEDALRRQAQTGKRLGSLLLELGQVDYDTLLSILKDQAGVPSANLFDLQINPALVEMVPLEKLKEHRVLPVAAGTRDLYLAMADPGDVNAITNLEFMLGRAIHPVVVASGQLDVVLSYLESQGGTLPQPMKGSDIAALAAASAPPPAKRLDIRTLFNALVEQRGTDLLLSAGVPPCLKKNNEVVRLSEERISPQDMKTLAMEFLSERQQQEFKLKKELDFACTFPEIGRFRVNVYQQRNSLSIAARYINERIPSFDELELPNWLEDFALKPQGLILVTGPTGQGKTTTLAALVDIINTRRRCNIITIEDPIEYLHRHKASNVNQREVGIDTDSFHGGLRHIFRQSPDVIVIGEMRDQESFAIALQAAATGHLVLSTMHSNTATSAIDRIIDVFPPVHQQQVRVQLADALLLVLNQRLVQRVNRDGRVLALERLTNSYRVRNLIREGKSHQIRTLLQQSAEDFYSMDLALSGLVAAGKTGLETALHYAENAAVVKEGAQRHPRRK